MIKICAACNNSFSKDEQHFVTAPTLSPDLERVHKVLLKNTRGHAFFERGEPVTDAPVSIIAVPLSSLSEQVHVWFERGAVQGALASWPEAGSRLMQHIATGQDMLGEWIVVQPERYRYSLEEDGGLVVRSVIWNYLATEVSLDGYLIQGQSRLRNSPADNRRKRGVSVGPAGRHHHSLGDDKGRPRFAFPDHDDPPS